MDEQTSLITRGPRALSIERQMAERTLADRARLTAALATQSRQIPVSEYQLPNGLTVVLSLRSDVPIVAINVWYSVGSKDDPPQRSGLTNLVQHMMFQGSEHLAKGEHFALVQQAGGTLNASTWMDRTNFFETLPSHELELGLWLEADRMQSLSTYTADEKVDIQREVVKNERRWSVDGQPYGTWDELIQARLYPTNHPYHRSTIGSVEDLNAITVDDVYGFYETYYWPNNAVLTLAGDFEPDMALAMIERHFAPIPASPNPPPSPDFRIAPLLGEPMREEVDDPVPLPRVYLAYRMPPFGTHAFFDLAVAADILGTGRASRLYSRLVDEANLARDVTVFPFPIVGGASMFTVSATARPEVSPDQLEAAMLEEINQLATEGPSLAEMGRVRNLHAAAVGSSLERIAERADRLSMYACLFDESGRINEEVSRYLAVDADRVRHAMADTLRADNRLVLTYLPAEEGRNHAATAQRPAPFRAEALEELRDEIGRTAAWARLVKCLLEFARTGDPRLVLVSFEGDGYVDCLYMPVVGGGLAMASRLDAGEPGDVLPADEGLLAALGWHRVNPSPPELPVFIRTWALASETELLGVAEEMLVALAVAHRWTPSRPIFLEVD